MKIVELILDEEQEVTGVEAISIVENPAIEASLGDVTVATTDGNVTVTDFRDEG